MCNPQRTEATKKGKQHVSITSRKEFMVQLSLFPWCHVSAILSRKIHIKGDHCFNRIAKSLLWHHQYYNVQNSFVCFTKLTNNQVKDGYLFFLLHIKKYFVQIITTVFPALTN
ncbi:hypothetical protein ILYODFUR_036919 [Ilyodon furcidens]|uniref:Uncharacterized protein n=1 Tax=Ilyodon furcidens TaxID=33524 RepID=A0ABV0UYB1_9TELE